MKYLLRFSVDWGDVLWVLPRALAKELRALPRKEETKRTLAAQKRLMRFTLILFGMLKHPEVTGIGPMIDRALMTIESQFAEHIKTPTVH